MTRGLVSPVPPAAQPSPAMSALVVIDTQKDFVDPGAVAEIPGTADMVPWDLPVT